MELNTTNQKENPLFNRKEIEFNVRTEVTPSKQEIQKLISEKLSAPIEAIKLKGIHGKFGSKNFTIKANVYNSVEDKERIEPKSKKEKEMEKKVAEQVQVPEEAKLAEETQEEKTGEKPTEEKSIEKNVADAGDEGSDNKSQESNEQKGSELKSENKSKPLGEANKEE